MPEAGRHDADDRVRVHVGADAFAEDVGIGAELPAPERVADDDAVDEPGHPVLLSICRPQRRLDPEHLEIVRACAEQLGALDVAGAAEGDADGPDGADLREDAGLFDVLHLGD